MDRYSKILEKNSREIVLLKSNPCTWGDCYFCDYINDNSENKNEMIELNNEILRNVTGEFNKLEVINSASVFELPQESLVSIKDIVREKNIETLYFESHYMYRNRLDEIRNFFPDTKIIFKCGIESFDNEFREGFLNKGARFESYTDVCKHFESICLMVGIKGQTKEMIRKDIDILVNNFKYGCVNVYTENSTIIKSDPELIKWFQEEFSYLNDYDNIEVLWNNTDFGVGE